MLPGVTSTRLGADRCPGLLTPFVAQDGAIIRLRIPGGRVHVSTLAELLAIGTDFGAPMLAVTSRTNLQVRGLPDPLPEEVMVRAEATGLLPSSTHERARNILAAPRAPELGPLVAELDVALCADPLLADLPGRFLFAVSDATGSVLTEPFDVAYQALTPTTGVLRVGGLGMPCARDDAVAHLLERPDSSCNIGLVHASGTSATCRPTPPSCADWGRCRSTRRRPSCRGRSATTWLRASRSRCCGPTTWPRSPR